MATTAYLALKVLSRDLHQEGVLCGNEGLCRRPLLVAPAGFHHHASAAQLGAPQLELLQGGFLDAGDVVHIVERLNGTGTAQRGDHKGFGQGVDGFH